jgi:predicted nuclease of restriction endonuclease-like (RecB) superfamily
MTIDRTNYQELLDEYTFDFLELGNAHSERQLEQAILSRVEPSILRIVNQDRSVSRSISIVA